MPALLKRHCLFQTVQKKKKKNDLKLNFAQIYYHFVPSLFIPEVGLNVRAKVEFLWANMLDKRFLRLAH